MGAVFWALAFVMACIMALVLIVCGIGVVVVVASVLVYLATMGLVLLSAWVGLVVAARQLRAWWACVCRKWKGKGLALPHDILVRLLVKPVILALAAIVVALVLVGWGRADAARVWKALA